MGRKLIDITGKMFGSWKVINYDKSSYGNPSRWICKCEACNKVKSLAGADLSGGKITNCSCASRINLDGKIFSGWRVLGYENGKRVVECVICKERKSVPTNRILHEAETIFCPCRVYRNGKWGGNSKRYQSEYGSWSSMINRCYNINDISYTNYGGRFIYVCDEWINDFNRFLSDMGPKPSVNYSIDRIDVNGPYCKENCKWSSKIDQGNNRRNNAYETINDITLTRTQWYQLANTIDCTVRYRMQVNSMSFEDALFKNNRLLNIVERVKIN